MMFGVSVYGGTLTALPVQLHVLTLKWTLRSWDRYGAGYPSSFKLGGWLLTTSKTPTVIRAFLLAMVLYPKAYAKAQEEMDRVIGGKRLPTTDDRDSLPYLECLLKEVYRYMWNDRTTSR